MEFFLFLNVKKRFFVPHTGMYVHCQGLKVFGDVRQVHLVLFVQNPSWSTHQLLRTCNEVLVPELLEACKIRQIFMFNYIPNKCFFVFFHQHRDTNFLVIGINIQAEQYVDTTVSTCT